jgi:hypothetical protein
MAERDTRYGTRQEPPFIDNLFWLFIVFSVSIGLLWFLINNTDEPGKWGALVFMVVAVAIQFIVLIEASLNSLATGRYLWTALIFATGSLGAWIYLFFFSDYSSRTVAVEPNNRRDPSARSMTILFLAFGAFVLLTVFYDMYR